MAEGGKHTIVLIQKTNQKSTRTYADYNTVTAAIDGICRMFEDRLKELNPRMPNITYDISDLYRFIDTFPEVSALTQDPRSGQYTVNGKEWIKQRIYRHLRNQAGQ